MRYGIISDVHSNLEALTEIFRILENKDIDVLINCGDLVGYGAEPNRCTELVRKFKSSYSVKGNHEAAVLFAEEIQNFSFAAEKAAFWTSRELTPDNIAYLSSTPEVLLIDDIEALHGTPYGPVREYMWGEDAVARSFLMLNRKICFVGHTHRPAVFVNADSKIIFEEKISSSETLKIIPNYNYIINPGSVGQPRDRIPDASACIYDSGESTIEFLRCPYDIETAMKKIEAAGLPAFLSRRLPLGE